MACSNKYLEFLAYAKIESSKLAYEYVIAVNHGKCGEKKLIKLRLLRSLIKTLESYAGIKRRIYLSNDCSPALFCVETCLDSKEICNIVNKIKSLIKNCK